MGRARALALVVLSLLVAVPAMGGAPTSVRFVDERGERIEAPLEACVMSGLTTDCTTVKAGAVHTVPDFDRIRIEGPLHGPRALEPHDLDRDSDEPQTVTVPRKGWLEVHGLASEETLTASLYAVDHPTFRRPVHRAAIGTEAVPIPAGDFLLSLAAPGVAPYLQPIAVEPAEWVEVPYRARPGWSLLLRVTDEGSGLPLAGATARIAPMEGFGAGAARRGRSGEDGLVWWNGLDAQLAEAIVSAAGLQAERITGLSASPGTSTFREVPLTPGARLRATVSIDGEPVVEARCRLLTLGSGEREPETIFEGTTSEEGVCRADGIPEGSYSLRILPKVVQSVPPTESWTRVWLAGGQETVETVELTRLWIEGRVVRGEEPAAGYSVAVGRVNEISRMEQVGEVESGEDGRYRLPVWETGEYMLVLQPPHGGLADLARLWVGGGGAVHDFEIATEQLVGRVVDANGQPVERARVSVRWRGRRVLSLATDDEGGFGTPLPGGGGEAELTAYREGYRRSKTALVTVPDGGEPPVVLLRLGELEGIGGRVMYASGEPAAGVTVWAYSAGSGGEYLGTSVSRGDGRFEVPGEAGAVRLFWSGGGCPLGTSIQRVETSSSEERPLLVACSAFPAHVHARLVDDEGSGLAARAVTLHRGSVDSGTVVPREVLAGHLAALGVAARTDGQGRLSLVVLEPGTWDFYLAERSNPDVVAAGQPFGYLATVELRPGETQELEITVRRGP